MSRYSTMAADDARPTAGFWPAVDSRPARRAITLILALAAALVAAWATAPAASAHLRSGTLAVDYRASLWHPRTSAYDARIYQSDHGLTLTVRAGHAVVLVGYLGEPVFRLDDRGLAINAASPTAVAVRLLTKRAAVTSSVPVWHLEAHKRTATWHDARDQGLPPGLSTGVWRVPLIVDGRRLLLEGELRRFPRPAPWVWLAVLALCLAAGGWLVGPAGSGRGARRAERAVTPVALLAAGAAAVCAIGFALDAYASPGTWILVFDAIAFLAVGLGVLLRGPEHLRPAGAIGTGLVALAIGLFTVPVFLHAIVLSVLPGTLTRLLTTVAIGAGMVAAALGGREYSRIGSAAHREADIGAWPPA